jgi:hypothetical protein
VKRKRVEAITTETERGELVINGWLIVEEKRGRKPAIARDVAVMLHFDYLAAKAEDGQHIDGGDPRRTTVIYEEVRKLFVLSDRRAVQRCIAKARAHVKQTFRRGGLDLYFGGDSTGVNRLMLILEDPGSFRIMSGEFCVDGRGYICRWHDKKARLGRIMGPSNSTDRRWQQ